MLLDLQHPLRKVAILVSSLDKQWAKRILADLPVEAVKEVLAIAEQLGTIDPTEQREIVKEFRRSMAAELVASEPTPSVSTPQALSTPQGVELDASLLARFESEQQQPAHEAGTYGQTPLAAHAPLSPSRPDAISNANPGLIADMLIKEHPQTIAVALSRFEHQGAADVLALLPTELQAEVLSRIADLDRADPQTLQVVESQLAEWLNQQEQRKQRMADGAEMVQSILRKSPQGEGQTLLTRISRLKPELAGQLENCFQSENQTIQRKLSLERERRTMTLASSPPTIRAPRELPPFEAPPRLANPMAALERADDQTLLAVFSQTENRTVMLALAGASEALLKRMLRGMPRRDAKQFRKQLRAMGPTRLSDMLSAQQELAHQIQQMGAAC